MMRVAPELTVDRFHGLRQRIAPSSALRWRIALIFAAGGVALFAALAATVALSSPLPLLGLLALAFALVLVGPEVCISVALLLGCGLAPFVSPMQVAAGGIPYWLLGFGLAAGLIVAVAVARWLAGEPVALMQPSVLLWLALALLVYSVARLAQSSPMDAPSIAAPFVALPLGALLTFVWLMHDRALEGLQKAMPVVIAIVLAWTVMYILGAAGFGIGQRWVGTVNTNTGLLGGGSRLYTWGQEAQLGFVLLATARAMYRPSWLWIALSTLGVLSVLLQNSRAQQVAVFGGLVVLLIWRLYHVRAATKLLLLLLAALAVYAVLASSVGEHIVSGYQGLREGSGTGGYRLGLLDQIQANWSLLGTGVSYASLDLGYNQDLGVPNTILLIGFAGAALQLALLGTGVVRALLARTALGVSLAAVLVMVLLARPSLPFLETGTGAVAYGVALGGVAALYVRDGRRSDASAVSMAPYGARP